MRHKRTINLYDEDDAHREILIYLEGISGGAREQQALVQMCLIGYRVMAFQESGEQAWFSVRNPDALKITNGKRRNSARLSSATRTYEEEGTNNSSKSLTDTPSSKKPTSDHEAVESTQHVAKEIAEKPETNISFEQEQITKNDAVELHHDGDSEFDLDEEFNTLKILQQMGGR